MVNSEQLHLELQYPSNRLTDNDKAGLSLKQVRQKQRALIVTALNWIDEVIDKNATERGNVQ